VLKRSNAEISPDDYFEPPFDYGSSPSIAASILYASIDPVA